MLPKQLLVKLTDRQREVIRLRYRYRWQLQKIALHLGISKTSAFHLLRRAHLRLGVPPGTKITVRKRKPRPVRFVSLSNVFNV